MAHPTMVVIRAAWLCFSLVPGLAEVAPPLEDGTYLVRLLFVRHGFSCANVPWKACTTDADKLTEEGMGASTYKAQLAAIDEALKPEEPASMVGLDSDWGFRPRGWKIPGQSKTADGKSDDCLFKVKNKSLVDDQYDEEGNLVALRQIVKDPHVTACDQHKAKSAAEVLAGWLEEEGIEFDLVGSSSLKRAIETVELVYMQSPHKSAARKLHGTITVLPYLNEKNEGTPFQPENFPYPPGVQEKQMKDLFGEVSAVDGGLTFGEGAYPREDQQWDKFKAVLALQLLPGMAAQEGDEVPKWRADPKLRAALEAGRAEGKPAIPVMSNWPQVRDEPLQQVEAGGLEYKWQEPVPPEAYDAEKEAGAKEFVVGIGSHSGLLKQYCLEGVARPHNLAVLEKKLQVRVSTSGGKTTFEVAEVEGPCQLIMDAPAAPVPGSLTSSDLGENCKIPFDIAPFMDVQDDPADGETSECMAQGGPEHFPLAQGDGKIAAARLYDVQSDGGAAAGGSAAASWAFAPQAAVAGGIAVAAALVAAIVAAFGCRQRSYRSVAEEEVA